MSFRHFHSNLSSSVENFKKLKVCKHDFISRFNIFQVGYIITDKSDFLNEAAQNTIWVLIRYF
jgi:hypothetical protein